MNKGLVFIGVMLLILGISFTPLFAQYVNREELREHTQSMEKKIDKVQTDIEKQRDSYSQLVADMSTNTQAIKDLKCSVERINSLFDKFFLYLIGTFITAGIGGGFIGYTINGKKLKDINRK